MSRSPRDTHVPYSGCAAVFLFFNPNPTLTWPNLPGPNLTYTLEELATLVSMSKRRRGNNGARVAARAPRPIDKKLVGVVQTLSSAAQVSTTLMTATFPCTVVGLRWELSALQQHATANSFTSWAIVLVKDGQSVSNQSVANGSDFYTPEQDVLAFGTKWVAEADAGTAPVTADWSGNTKTMRKLMGGDTIQFIGLCDQVNGAIMRGVVQFFCKT